MATKDPTAEGYYLPGTREMKSLPMIKNYIYISHLDEGLKYWFLPSTPEQINDSMQSNFQPTNALGRTAPVYTYSNSGPRTVQIDLALHRDLMNDINIGMSNVKLGENEEYIENLIRALQAIAVPKFNLENRAVEPPLVALRIEEQIFIKGIVTGSIGVVYKKPILTNNKFADITVSFTISEIDPYDSESVYRNGSFRGVVKTLKEGMNMGDVK